LSAIRHPDLHFILVGDEQKISHELKKCPRVKNRSVIRHTTVAVKMDDKPSQALRSGRWKSSMWQAIEAVKHGEADACISAGNTGALMAMARFCLRNFENIERPAIAAIWPTLRGESIVLDVGASIGADAEQLVNMAVLGAAMARALYDLEHPTVGLLNVGVEEVKGLEAVKEAAQRLRLAKLPGLQYEGFVEGTDIGKGTVDVIVTEGFAGNIALKTAEGTAKQISEYLKAALGRTFLSRLGALLAMNAFKALKMKLDPRKANGGVFLGLNGIVIKSHGGTDDFGFASAIDLGYDMAKNNFMKKLAEDEARLKEQHLIGPDVVITQEAVA
ncbi:MAG: phosphate acyltransferase PlsX, partial [Pseudomonadota bacterium]